MDPDSLQYIQKGGEVTRTKHSTRIEVRPPPKFTSERCGMLQPSLIPTGDTSVCDRCCQRCIVLDGSHYDRDRLGRCTNCGNAVKHCYSEYARPSCYDCQGTRAAEVGTLGHARSLEATTAAHSTNIYARPGNSSTSNRGATNYTSSLPVGTYIYCSGTGGTSNSLHGKGLLYGEYQPAHALSVHY